MFRRIFSLLIIGFLSGCLILIACNRAVQQAAEGKTFAFVEDVPSTYPVALVLGTTSSIFGRPNLFYTARIDAAIALYRAGKIKHIIVSGDNSSKYYDEPTEMLEDLVASGVPEHIITPDFAGFRTLDSIVRAKKVFGQNRILIVSQCFHGERGIYLAQHHAVDAVAFCAADVHGAASQKTYLREYLARVKAVLDVWVLGTQPQMLGEEVVLPNLP